MNSQTSKIIGIQFGIMSPEEIIKNSVAEITNRDTYIGIKPVIGGLFDPRMGVLESNLICPTDGLDYINCPGYFGHVKLARPVFYIQYLSTITKIVKCVCFKCSKLKISKQKYKYLLKMPAEKRWNEVFQLCSKVKRCGDENDDGCGCIQPTKIKKDGFATLNAEWSFTNGPDEKNDTVNIKLTPEVVLKMFKRISDDDVHFMGFSPIWSRPEWMISQVLAIPPPCIRPSVKHDGQRSEDDLSHIIINIIKTNQTLKEKIDQNATMNIIDGQTSLLQYYISTMIDNKISGASPLVQRSGRALKSITERHKGKPGRVRGNLMGKRVDYSARSVITPDPVLSIRELGVPMKIAKNLTKPVKVNRNNKQYLTHLIQNGPDIHPGAKTLQRKNGDEISLRFVDRESLVLEEGDIVHRHLIDGDYVLFNRQPSLHKMSMMGHVVKVMKKGDTFRMNVADTKPYNADFDGDEMNMHVPQDDEAELELKYLAAIPYQIISPADNKSIIGVFQDSLVGSYQFTRENIKFTPKEAMNLLIYKKNIDKSIFEKDYISNFDLLSQILPNLTLKYPTGLFKEQKDDFNTSNKVLEIKNGKIIRGQFEKGVLGASGRGLIQRIFNDFSPNASSQFIDDLQNIITEYMKQSCFSVGISDLIANNETNDQIKEKIIEKKKEVSNIIDKIHLNIFENKTGKSNKDEFETQVNQILNQATKEAGNIGIDSLDNSNRFITLVISGSKGNSLNISQMISCLGQQNVDNKRIPYSYDNRTLPHFHQYDDTPKARGFVENSFIGGLEPTELFFHAMGGRVGLIDTAVKTSQTGYIQRRLIKGLEDIQIKYDMTVRNHKNKVIQFNYGGNNIDTAKTEKINFKLIEQSNEEIYETFSIFNYDKGILEFIYDKETIPKFNKSIPEIKTKILKIIEDMIQTRNVLVEKVYNFNDDSTVYHSINFNSLINNIKEQLNINDSSLSNITPLEFYNKIDKCYSEIESYAYCKPSKLFKSIFYYYLNPSVLIHKYKFHSDAVDMLLELIKLKYKQSIVQPGEMVGLIAAQSIGEPTTQMTLNTFHFAGISSKSNVTRGVPRIEELLSLTDKLKNPSLTIFMKPEDETNNEKAFELITELEHTKLENIVNKLEIYYDPTDDLTLIDDDKDLIYEYNMFKKIIEHANDEQEGADESQNKTKWILRMEMNKTQMLDMNITMEEIHFALKSIYKNNIFCIYSDMNDNNLIFRIRLNKLLDKKNKGYALDQSDEIYMLKSFKEELLHNIVIRGIKNIEKVNLRKIKKYLNYNFDTQKYDQKEINVLDTIGNNLLDILSNDLIDPSRSYSNNIIEMKEILGIEAARQCLFQEILDVMEFDSTYINHHHIELLCDRMTCNNSLVSINRHGINNDNIGPIAKASFEETSEMFAKAAKHGELDEMTGISSNIMCGQVGKYGTSAFNVYLNMNEFTHINNDDEYIYEDQNEDELLDFIEHEIQGDIATDFCSIQNIEMNNNFDQLTYKNTGNIDDDYDIGI